MMIWILLFGTNILADQGIKDKKKKAFISNCVDNFLNFILRVRKVWPASQIRLTIHFYTALLSESDYFKVTVKKNLKGKIICS